MSMDSLHTCLIYAIYTIMIARSIIRKSRNKMQGFIDIKTVSFTNLPHV